MVTAAAWVVFPAVFYLVAAGLGLAAERLARITLPDALLAPVGACLGVLLALLVLKLGGAGYVMGPVLVVVALAGMLLSRRGLGSRLVPGWAGAAALAAFALYMGPVVLSGHWTWLGYNFVNDAGINFAVTDHVLHHGTALITGEPSTRMVVVNDTLTRGYPLGAHALLAALSWIAHVPVEATYQPFVATIAAFAAMALAWLARSVGIPSPAAALCGLVAVGANLTYHYALHGAFKELSLVLVVATGAAVCRFALDADLKPGAIAVLAACLAAGIGIFTAGAVGYVAGLTFVALLAIGLERPRQRIGAVGRAAAVGAVVIVITVAPVLTDALGFARTGTEVFAETNADLSKPLTSPAVLGHLARPLPLSQSLGVWLRDDYRYPIAPGLGGTMTTVLLATAAVLLAVALVEEVRRRRLAVLLAVGPALLVYALGAPRLEPYAQAKLLVVLSPMVVFGAVLGAWRIYQWRRVRALGAVLALAISGGVIVSDALAYHEAYLAPTGRMEALRDAAEHTEGRGTWLLPEWEEFAKHFGAAAALNVGPESFSPRPIRPNGDIPLFHHSFDLDEIDLDYLESWDGLMLRRSPEASRPPANYRRTYANDYYELWQRDGDPSVLEHMPLQRPGQPAVVPRCSAVRQLAGRALPGERLIAAERDALPTLGVTDPPLRGAAAPRDFTRWPPEPDSPGEVIPTGPGRIPGTVDVPADGVYRVWIKGGGGRAMSVTVDGRAVGSATQINTPGQWLTLRPVRLTRGPHEILLTRRHGGLAPGNGVNGVLGGIALQRQAPERLVSVPPARAAARLCGQPWDWIERVSG